MEHTTVEPAPTPAIPVQVVNGNGKRDRVRDYIMGIIGIIAVATLAWLANACMTAAPMDGNFVYQTRGDIKEVLIFILGYFGGQINKGGSEH